MCLPPVNKDPSSYFSEVEKVSKDLSLPKLSMGMSADFLVATKYFSTYVRIGSSIFGQRF